MKQKLYYYILWMVAALVGFSACIMDDVSSCPPPPALIHFSVSGINTTDHRYRFEIIDADFLTEEDFPRQTDTVFVGDIISASIVVKNLSANRLQPTLKITDLTADNIIFPDRESTNPSLARLILSAYPGNNFKTRREYWIDIVFFGSDIWVNGWRYTADFEYELYPN